MATYVLPQVLVFQDFTVAPVAAANPLSSYITGGNAFLTRTSDTDEKENGFLGYYDDSQDTDYLWPNRPAGAVVDTTYTTVYIENALLEYFKDDAGGGDDILTVAGYHNRIKATSLNFATNGAYGRTADKFFDRDVKLGDEIRVRAGTDVVWATVKDLIANTVSATVAQASFDGNNPALQSVQDTITKVGGPDNCVSMVASGNTAYVGVYDGFPTETYTVTVTESSINNDLTTAVVRVTSASGTDDQASVVPGAAEADTTIGTRGLKVKFTDLDTAQCSTNADEDDVSYDDLIVGQSWTVKTEQDWKPAVPTGPTPGNLTTYDSTNNATYIVEVTRGGYYSDTLKPQITVNTTNGSDASGPHTVSDHDTNVTIGTHTVTIQFSDNAHGAKTAALNKGDKYYIAVTGETTGAVQTIVLSDNIPATVVAGTQVAVNLYIRKPLLEVAQNRIGYAPVTNWQQTSTQISLENGARAFDDSWTESGVLTSLPIFSESSLQYGKLYVTYRAWEITKAYEINSITDVGDIDDIPGSLTPDNPLKWGVYKALTNSNSTAVLYSAVPDPADADDWDEVLELAQSRDDIHAMVPLTRDPTVLGLFQAHVGAMSTENEGLWRTAWFSLQGIPEIPLVSTGSTVPGHTTATTSDGLVCEAIIEEDDLTAGQYTQVRNEGGNGKFITNGVLPGDIVRAHYVSDQFENTADTYTEYVVDSVQSEQQLILKTGPAAPDQEEAKIEIWRTLTLTEESTEIAKDAGSYYDRRIMAIWPDTIETSGTIQEGYHLCAALAGLTSGVLPQQGLTRLGIAGFTDVQRTARFSKSQLDKMAISGTWIVMQAPDGNIFTRHAVTTGNYSDINQREEMLTRNVDSISYRFKDFFEPYIGITNVTPSMESVLRAGIDTLIDVLTVERFTVNLGGQLIGATLDTFEIHPLFKDRYVAKITCDVPYALNNLEIHLIV